MDKNDKQIIESLKQEVEDLKKQIAAEKEENRRLRSQLDNADSPDQMKISVKKALAKAGAES